MTVLIKKHATAPFGRAVFFTFALLVGCATNATFGTGAFLKDTAKGLSSILASENENRPLFDVGRGGDRFLVLNYMNSDADHRCTIKVMKQDILNKPGSPCQSFGDLLIYKKVDGDPQIILGEIKGRNIETKVVIVPNEWQNGEWRTAVAPGFDWAKTARILMAGNAH